MLLKHIGIKFVCCKYNRIYLVLLYIPKSAEKRESEYKCRSSFANVLCIINDCANKQDSVNHIGFNNMHHSLYPTKYTIGKVVVPDYFHNGQQLCSNGIHYFPMMYINEFIQFATVYEILTQENEYWLHAIKPFIQLYRSLSFDLENKNKKD